MRVVFFGTPEVAAVALDSLLGSSHETAAVVTQPDRPKGRSGRPAPSPVKERALRADIPVLQPESPRDESFVAALAAHGPAAGVVVAYGHILPSDVLAVPPRGFVNVHYSLLPRYRGAAPVQRAVMAGETETGVTTFLLEPSLDTGPILLVAREPIAPDDTSGTLMERLARVGARLLVETLDGLEAGTLEPRAQDPALATPAPKIKPEEGAIDWTHPAARIADQIRGLNPSPGAHTSLRGKRLKIWRAQVVPGSGKSQPGAILEGEKDRFIIGTGDGALELNEVQIEGGKRLDSGDFVRGHRPNAGEVVGT